MPQTVTAICPGTFDPVTVGHLDIIRRGAAKFDRVVVGIIETPQRKAPLFSPDERAEFVREALADLDNVVVDRFHELVVSFARKWEAQIILKGLRAISDFEYEFAMAQLNRNLAPEIETVFMMASPEHSFELERRQGDCGVWGVSERSRTITCRSSARRGLSVASKVSCGGRRLAGW